MLYLVIVQAILLFGAETWFLNPRIRRLMGGFHHRVATGGQDLGIPPAGGGYACSRIGGDGDLCIKDPEYVRTIHFDVACSGPLPGVGVEAGIVGT